MFLRIAFSSLLHKLCVCVVVVALWRPVPYFLIWTEHMVTAVFLFVVVLFTPSTSLSIVLYRCKAMREKINSTKWGKCKIDEDVLKAFVPTSMFKWKEPLSVLIWVDLSPSHWIMCVAFNVWLSCGSNRFCHCSNKSSPMNLCIINKPPKFHIFPSSEWMWTTKPFVKSRSSIQTGNWLHVLSSSWFSLSLTLAVSQVENNP